MRTAMPKTPKTTAQKQTERRERLSNNGLFKRRDFYCHPEDEPALRALETFYRDKRLSENPKSEP